MGFLTKLFKLIFVPLVVFVGVLLGPNTLPENVKFTEFKVNPVKCMGENFVENDVLNNAERLFENEIKGPEGFEVLNSEVYTTLHGGYVAKVFEDQVVPVVKFGEPCEGWWEESKCGRPLGIKAYDNNHLIVADAYYGIFKFNVKTGKFTNLVDKNTIIEGHKPKIFNSVEVASDGSIYWTHSSSDFSIEDGLYTFLADGSGRLIKYDPATKRNTVLMKDLYFANGIVLSPNEDYLLISETGHSRIHRYHLKGPNKSKSETFMDGLPGMPDNLRSNGADGYFVPLVIARDEKNPALFQVISPFPSLRKFFARFMSLIEFSLDKIDKIYPNYFLKRAIHFVGHLESFGVFLPIKTTILEVDQNGKVIRSYHGTDGSVSGVSDVLIHNGYMYFGSPYNNYLGRVKLSKLQGAFSTKPKQALPSQSLPKASSPSPSTRPPPPPPTRPPPPPSTTTRPSPPPTRPPPPSTTTRPPPPSTKRPPPPTTTRPPPPPTRPPPPPSTTTRSPPPPTRPPPPPPTTTRPPPPPTRPPPPPSTTTRPPPPPTRPPPPSTATRPPPPPSTRPPPPSKIPSQPPTASPPK